MSGTMLSGLFTVVAMVAVIVAAISRALLLTSPIVWLPEGETKREFFLEAERDLDSEAANINY